MNGIKVMFGQIGKILTGLFICSEIFISCIGKSSKTCQWEKQNYTEKWDYVVEKTYKHSHYKATYIIVTTGGKEIYFQPIQDIVSIAEKGDRIFKEPNSKYAFIITESGDSIHSRIFSTICDSMVE